MQHLRHIVGIVVNAARIVAQGGFQRLVGCHLLAVEEGLILTEAADIEAGVVNALPQWKLVAQIAGCDNGMPFNLVVGIVASNPVCLPVVAVEEADFEWVHPTFHFLFSASLATICDGGVHPPPAAGAAFQRLTGIFYIQHLRGVDDF